MKMQYHQSHDNKTVKHMLHFNIISKHVSMTTKSVFNNAILKSEVKIKSSYRALWDLNFTLLIPKKINKLMFSNLQAKFLDWCVVSVTG
jgi:hypothetical protein